MDSILTGKQDEIIVPKPGEFFIVSSDSLPSLNRKLINQAIRDSQASEFSPMRQSGGSKITTHHALTHKMKPPNTDRKKQADRNRASNLTHQAMPHSSSTAQFVPYQRDGLTMSSYQGEITREMSQTNINQAPKLRKTHDFPPTILSAKNKISGEAEPLITVQSPMDGVSQGYMRQSADFTSGNIEGGVGPFFQQTVHRKQLEVIQNPQLKTSLTTSIRNIMRNQDKGLLTTSTRLLNAQVKRAELKTEAVGGDKQVLSVTEQKFNKPQTNPNPGSKAISTIDLLRKQKEMHKKMRQLSQSSTGERDEDSIGREEPNMPIQSMQNAISMPVLPTLNEQSIIPGFGGAQTEHAGNTISDPDMYMISQRDPFADRIHRGDNAAIPNRPNSTVLMQLGDKKVKNMIKKKFDLSNARQRDPTKAIGHSYQSKLHNPVTTSQKWKQKQSGLPSDAAKMNSHQNSVTRMPSTPILVQYQNALNRENKNISPFMVNGPELDPKMMTIEPPMTKNQLQTQMNRMQPSQSLKNIPPISLDEPIQEYQKYSESMLTLKKLRNADEETKNRPSSSIFKKGTADFIKRKMKDYTNNKAEQAYDTNDFQKSLEKRFKTNVQGNGQDRTFLPIEAFDPLLDIEVPDKVIEQYKDEASGQTIGLSKWNFPSGDAELRECIVYGYVKKQDLYEIRWCHNPEIQKKVSRFNLIFKQENKTEYERRIFLAHKFRQEAEILMRYNYMIDNTMIPKIRTGGGGKQTTVAAPELLDQTKTRISYLVSTFKPWKHCIEQRNYKNVKAFFLRDSSERYRIIKFYQRWQDLNSTEPERIVQQIHSDMQNRYYDLSLLKRLFEELDLDFIRAHKQIYFDLKLPFDKKFFKMFNQVLPTDKFIPVNEREAKHEQPPALKEIGERVHNFERLLDKMQVRLHQGHNAKLKILQMCHRFKQENLKQRLIQFEFTEPSKLDYLRKEHLLALNKFIKNVEDSRFDCEYDTMCIMNEKQRDIEQLNADNRKKMTHNQEQYKDIEVPEEFIRSMKNFQRLIQIQFENTMREVFIASVEQCKEQIRFAMQEVQESTGKPLLETDIYAVGSKNDVKEDEMRLEKQDVMKMSRDAVMQTRFRETQCFQFDITLEYDKDKKEIKANPMAEDWINAIPQHFEASLKSLTEVKCFLNDKLGRIHKSVGHIVFQTDPEVPEVYPEQEVLHITFLLQRLFKVLEALLESSNDYAGILQEERKEFLRKQKNQDYEVEDYQKTLQENKRKEEEIDELFYEDTLMLGPMVIRVGELKKRLKKKLSEMNKVLLEQIKRKIDNSKQKIGSEVDDVLEVVKRQSYINIEEVTETRKFIKELPDKMLNIQRLITGVNTKINVLDENLYRLEEQEIVNIWQTFARPREIQEEQGDCQERLDEFSGGFLIDLRVMQEKLAQEIQEIQQEFETIQEYEELKAHREASRKTEQLEERIDYSLEQTRICNHREMLFGQHETDFSSLDQVKEKFQPFSKLWWLAAQYFNQEQNWMGGEITELDGEKLPKEIDGAIQTLKSLKLKYFKEYPFTAQICQELRERYLELKPFMPVLNSLKNQDFKNHHFDIIKKDYGITVEGSLTQSLNQLKELGVMEFVDEIIEISAIATKERQLESQLNKMMEEWKSVKFELEEFRDSEVSVLKGVQTIWDLLDEHIQKTMIISSSPYCKYFLTEALYWKSRLVKIQEILEEWSRAQRGWCYLWPIFSSPDIQTQLPEVYVTFSTMDKMWRIIMSQTQQSPIVLDACNQQRAFENLKYCNETIEGVKKKLNEYLHSKQLLFPRFFFLSNDDLLHILSQTKDPVRVQDHLNKCFEGIQLLTFTESTLVVTSMLSAMDEEVKFNKQIDPFEIKVHKETIEETLKDAPTGRRHRARVVETVVREVRPIEDWLTDVEFQMRDSLRSNIHDSSTHFDSVAKKQWIFSWPQQIVLAIDQLDWTRKMEKSITSEGENSLRFAFRSEEEKVQELVELIRLPNLSQCDMRTLESLIVTDVHSRDVTQEIMELNVRDTAVFEWISQLRHYTSIEDSVTARGFKGEPRLEILISMINSTRYYGFEYQGSQTRLVITPLTDRCYRTLMGALQLNLGGAPEGPAGTGKTETSKDLAKALAKQCLVFNCSDQMDVPTMGKFFKGLACCGAWACFDEFNRIELEVLSVIAQQILTIQNKLVAMKGAPTSKFEFEDEKITLNAQCAVFITMNPTYAGRSQLPDNLKALFRPVAMMIPNYETIAEIQLYSYGFQKARHLSVKIVQSLKLSSEQLSTQSHYDYGMRAVKSIILASGALRKEYPDQDEAITVLRAISVCNIPKFIQEDIDQFNGIISDLFPDTDNSPQQYEVVKKFVASSIEDQNLQWNQEFETKIIQLYETVQVRHGLMLVGAPMGGKTTVMKTLADALSKIERQKAIEESSTVLDTSRNTDNKDPSTRLIKAPKVRIHQMNPKSVSISKLYGDYEKVGDWVDGILGLTVREAAGDKSGDTHWVMLDGPVDTLWIENLNTVLDDNKKLCLISGEIIKLTEKMTMMFEVEDLVEASPATVSRCGMVYVTPEKLGWEPLLHHWVALLPSGFKEDGMEQLFPDLIMAFVPEIMSFLFGKEQSQEEDQRLDGLKPVIKVSKNWVFRSFLNVFESLLLDEETLESYIEKQNEAAAKKEINQKKRDLRTLTSQRTDRGDSMDDDDEELSHRKSMTRKSAPVKQRYFDIIEPGEINRIVQKFIMSLVWGFGSPLSSPARPKYSLFLLELIQKVFAPATCQFEFFKRVDTQLFPKSNNNLFSMFFNTRQMSWNKWDYEIEKYDILGDKEEPIEAIQNNSRVSEEVSEKGGVGSPMSGGEIQFDDEFQNKVEFQNIMVATEDTIQQQYLMETIVGHQFPLLIVGDTGTGKTRAVKKLISLLLKKQTTEGKYGWESGEMVLSATSTPAQIQQYTESKLEKHKKGVYGPKNPSNHLLIFIDDLNMPIREKFGAQPSLEMMRQIMDSHGFYNTKTLEFSNIVRQLFLCAMGTPGGGRSLPSMRLMRHFSLINFPNMSKETMTRIFRRILDWGFVSYNAAWQKQIIIITELTIETYQKAVQTLLPLPRKAHYLFNVRQISEIIQGLLSVPPEVVEPQKEKLGLLKRLWIHEVMRVFSDRLIDHEDKDMFVRECLSFEDSSFFKKEDIENAHNLIFCNFVDANTDNPVYQESKTNDQLRVSLGKIIEVYNGSKTGGKKSLSLLLFDYFLQHLARVSRIISKANGNGLLIGLGGNGRKTIAKLATYINECQPFKIQLHKNYGKMEWLDDLRNLYKTLGIDNKKIVFSFSDRDIKEEQFIEDINNILNVGELTSLFAQEDEEEIHYEIEKQLKKARVKNTTQEATAAFFQKRCKRNLHLLLFMSPAGQQLQSYFRKYPSLVNCTQIDWFLNWPMEALKAVSDHYLLKMLGVLQESTQAISPFNSSNAADTNPNSNKRALETIAEGFEDDASPTRPNIDIKKIDQEGTSRLDIVIGAQHEDTEALEIQKMSVRDRVSQVFTQIHQSAMDLAQSYLKEKKRQVYVTPVMFMGLFDTFEGLLSRKNEEIERERTKYDLGVRKLDEAKVMIEEMEDLLTKMQPVLVAKTKEVEQNQKKLEKESKEVLAVKEIVDAETEEAENEKRIADGIKQECQQKLSVAQPFFDKAIKALRTLSQNDFQVMKALQHPPQGVRLALEGCCIMLGIQPTIKKVNGVKTPDYWEKSKKLITNYKKLLDQLENYPKESIDPSVLAKIQVYLADPNFRPEQIKTASEAAEGLCKWVIAICQFNDVYKEITPKRLALEDAEEKVRVTQEKLQAKQEQLNKLQEQLAELQAEGQQLTEEKQELLNKRQDATNKLDRANALMQSIGSEKDRWIATKKKLAEDKVSLLGDMILATSFANYLGPFEGTYRLKILQDAWQKLNKKYQIKFTPDFSLKEVLGDEEKISEWTIRGLPNETTAYENMIIIDETVKRKYPVIIDPQGQAFRYMRDNQNLAPEGSGMQSSNSNRVFLKASSSSTAKQLQLALQQGSIVFCENSGEVTSPHLLSVLRKETSMIQGDLYISFNDLNIEFDSDFRIYIFSHLSNPHFSPEVQQLGKVLNFSVTREGLEQQLLQIICRHELSKEEDERERYAKQTLTLQRRKREEIERILQTLRTSGQEILESDSFVKTLNESKETTTEIEKKLKQAKNTEEKIREFREKFEDTAKQGARLYFAVQDLLMLDDMYQFSMNWFRRLFTQTFNVPDHDSDEEEKSQQENSDASMMQQQLQQQQQVPKTRNATVARHPGGDLSKKQRLFEMEKRAVQLKNQFREILFRNVCMSLFERHKLLFAFFISLKVYERDQSFQEGLERLKKLPGRQQNFELGVGAAKEDKSQIDQSKVDNSSHISDTPKVKEQVSAAHGHSAVSQTRVSVPRKSANRGVLSRPDQSDRMTAIDEERELQQLEEQRKLFVDEALLKYTLTGLFVADFEPYAHVENPRPDLFTEAQWNELHQLSSFACFETLLECIVKDIASWEKFMQCDKQDQAFDLMPEPYQSTLAHFAWIPLIRCLKPELTTMAIRRYVLKGLGRFFVTPLIFSLKEVYEDSNYHTPLLIILTPGNDPMDQIKKLAQEKGCSFVPVSLGKGQGENAKRIITNYRKDQAWIVLQNCHLSKSFLPELEQIVEGLQPQTQAIGSNSSIEFDMGDSKQVNRNFRIWLTSMSVNYFPQMLLHQSLKVTSEPPKGLKSAMIRSYQQIMGSKTEVAWYDNSKKPDLWQRLFLSLSFFHAIVRERRRFGPLGWTAHYDFNDSDFSVSMRQLYLMVDNFEKVPFKALQYLTGQCNYGGRVTDDRDRRTLSTILDDFYNEQVIGDNTYYIVNERFRKYYIYKGESAKEYMDYCKHLPDEESPLLMGLHENAIIQQAMAESQSIFQNTIRLTQSSSGDSRGDEDSNALVKKLTIEILGSVREPFKIKEVERNYPFKYEESMNSVLLQELARYNKLVENIRNSLEIMLKTLEGRLVSNAETDELLLSIKNNSIPEKWLKTSYPSKKTLLGYVDDLKRRLSAYETWIEHGKPNCFWISGFFFTQSFLTGVKQNFARKYHHPIDKVDFNYEVLHHADEARAHSTSPEEGCYVHGFFLEGAGWDDEKSVLRESEPKVIHVPLPVMHFIPKHLVQTQAQQNQKPATPADITTSSMESAEEVKEKKYTFECPAYKTSERAGQLLTTGHNTNYIQMVDLASSEEPSVWIRRGVALLCQLDS